MDPITIVVAALAGGAAAGLKPTAEKVVKDAYSGLKALIQRKYGNVNIEALEKKPGSELKRGSLEEDLTDAGAEADSELLDQAKILLDIVKTHERETVAAIGVDLEKIEAEYLKLKRIAAEGTGVKVKDGKFSGGIDIEDVIAKKP